MQNKSRRKDSAKPADSENLPRRQNVLGGDLTGISKRRRDDFISRYLRTNVINTIAFALVMLIAIAFFWPQKNNSIKEVSERAQAIKSANFYNQSRLDTPAQSTAKQGFSRGSDISRAEQYRTQDALERQIRGLLSEAERYVANSAYTQPAGENAFEMYQAVQNLDARNVAARRGIEYLRGRFLESGYIAINKDNLSLANSNLSKLARIDNTSTEHQELSRAIDQYKLALRTSELLRKAESAFESNTLLLPARANALYFYQQVLQINPDNEAAQKGIQNIADLYINRASEQIALGNYDEAVAHVATVSVIDPQHPQIERTQNTIKTAQNIKAKLQVSNTLATASPQTNTGNVDTAKSTATQSPVAPSTKTPAKEAREQAAFDNEYLKQGLQAYADTRYGDSIALLQPLADKGIARAQYKIGIMTYYGQGTARNRTSGNNIIRNALPAITKFADEGRNWAQVDLGNLYENGIVFPRDQREAVFWYKSAADKGYPEAQYELGNAYRRGRGVTTNRRTAVQWFQRAAKQGNSDAVRSLRQMGISSQ